MIRIDGRAWIPKSVLNEDHLYNIKADLTIEPRKTSEYTDASPDPVKLFAETDQHIGVPRGWWDANNTGKFEVVDETTNGAPFGEVVVEGGVTWDDDDEWWEQLKARDALLSTLTTKGYGGGIIQAGCAFGKTVTALRIAYALGRRTLVIVNKGFFTRQWTDRINEFLPGARVGIVQQNKCEFRDRDIVIGMVHSLAGKDYDPLLYKSFGLVVTDECFPAGTKISTPLGPVGIEGIVEGDIVTNAIGAGRVTGVGSREVSPEELRLVVLDGVEHIVTAEHPFLTADSGWVTADQLAGERVVLYHGCIESMLGGGGDSMRGVRGAVQAEVGPEGEVLLARVLRQGQEGSDAPMSAVRADVLCSSQEDLLREGVCCGGSQCENVGTVGGDLRARDGVAPEEPVGRQGGVREDAAGQPDGQGGGQEEALGHVAGHGACSTSSGREGQRVDPATGDASAGPGSRMACRVRCEDGQQEGPRGSLVLGGHREQGVDGGGGVRWSVPWRVVGTGKRCGQGRVPGLARVDRVEVPQRADLERHGVRVVGDSGRVRVYNLSVSGHPSYVLADSMAVVHNCHRIAAPTWADVIPRFNAKYRLGLTATPRRKDGAEDVFFEHIGPVAFKATTEAETPQIGRMRHHIELEPVFYPGGRCTAVSDLKTSQIEKQVSEDMVRNTMYADKVVKAVEGGRKVFIVSKFIEHLYNFQDLIEAKLAAAGLGDTTIDWVTGQRYVFHRPDLDEDGEQRHEPVMVKVPVLDDNGEPVTKNLKPVMEKVEKTDEDGNVITKPVWVECGRDEGHRFKVARKIKGRTHMVWKTRPSTEDQLEAAESAQIIMATQQMIEEGFDVQALDVLVPLIPPYDIEQMAGRVRRRCKPKPSKCARLCPWRAGVCEGKPSPVILEPADSGVGKLERRHEARMRFYKSIGA